MKNPPRFARRLMRAAVPADVRDSVDGDLLELYLDCRARRGPAFADLWYWRETFSFAARFAADRVARLALGESAPSRLDFRLGGRLLARYPGLTFVAGIGIAAAIAISAGSFGFFYSHLYPRIPLPDGDRIVALENWNVLVNNEERRSLHDFVMWRRQMTSVGEISAFRRVESRLARRSAPPEPVNIAEMTASAFGVARVPAMLGRSIQAEDERPGAPPVLVIGFEVWRTRFEQNRAVIGQQVRLGDTVHTIVGVMPQGYAFPVNHQYWRALRLNSSEVERGKGPVLFVFGRLAPDATMETAQAELTAIGQRSAVAFPETNANLRPHIMPYTYPLMDIQDVAGWGVVVMQLMVTLVVIVVALNVSILVYARTTVRRGEIAVRTALGASRNRIVSQLFVEALALAFIPAALGLMLAQYGLALGTHILEQDGLFNGTAPFWTDYSVRPATIAYTLMAALLVATIVGVLPALQATGRRVEADLRQLSGGTGMRLGKIWTTLVVAQVAFAVAILPAAVKLGFNQIRGALTRPTYAAEEFVTASVTLPLPNADTTRRREYAARFAPRFTELTRRLRAEPAVTAVTFAAAVPGRNGRFQIEVEGLPRSDGKAGGHDVLSHGVDLGYFDAHGKRILTGRRFETSDLGGASNAVIVNRTFARKVVGSGTAVGRRIRRLPATAQETPGPWYEIVGVAEDMHSNALDPDAVGLVVNYPVSPAAGPAAVVLVRLRGGAVSTFGTRLHEIVSSVDPDLRLGTVRAGASTDTQGKLAIRLIAVVLSLILGTVLLLSAAGVYALMSFTVAQRQREIGIRTALGASPQHIMMRLFSRAARQVGAGVALGIIGAVLLNSTIEGPSFAASAHLLIPAIALIMMAVGILAAYGPARRGLRIQPTEALRGD
jgi:putative ABC transport system permease protein